MIFFLKNHSEFEKKGPQNLVFLICITGATITTRRPVMEYPCFLKCGVNCNSTETISSGRWKQLETKSKDYNGLDKFGNVFGSTDCEKGAEEFHIHERCYITLSFKWSLQQSWKRKEKENAANSPTIPEQHDLQEKECQPSSP